MVASTYFGFLAFLVFLGAGASSELIYGDGKYDLPSDIQIEYIRAALKSDETGLLRWFDKDFFNHPNYTEATRIWWHALGAVHDEYFLERPVRKEVRQLTARQWKRYYQAIQKMMNSFPDPENKDLSVYSILLTYHTFAAAPSAHFGAGFLPWHREYLARFEYLVQQYDPEPEEPPLAIPYVDFALDNRLPVPHDAIIWTSRFFGNNDGIVNEGPFVGITTSEMCLEDSNGSLPLELYRERDEFRRRGLWTDTDAHTIVLSKNRFGDLVCNGPDHCDFEGKHGGMHWFVGGHMNNVVCSPTDPIFHSHHALVDCLWEEFRMNSQTADPETDYPSFKDGFNTGFPEGAHEPDEPMSPFEPLKNIDGISNFYRDHLYTCAPRPSTIECSGHYECGMVKYLWCDHQTSRCVSKIREGGVCGYEGEDEEDDRYHFRCACLGRRQQGRCRKNDDGVLRCACKQF